MSIGPLNLPAAVAGAPLAQTSGGEIDRATQQVASQARQAAADAKADSAAGIGQTDSDSETSDRDADGRRLWEGPPGRHSGDNPPHDDKPRSRDPEGVSGNQLDLSG